MSLDKLAGAATRELLEHPLPDADWMLDELKRTRSQRRLTRYAAAAVAVLLLGGSWTLLQRGDGPPEPAGPTDVTSGAIIAPTADSAGARPDFMSFGADLYLPEDAARFASVAFTPDGSELVYPGPDRTIRAINVTTGSTRTLGVCLGDVCWPALSPDGTRLAYAAEEHLKIQTIDTGAAEPIHTPGVEHPAAPTWSPNGDFIAFTSPRGLYTVDIASGEVRELARYTRRAGNLTTPSWSPDGRTIAFLDHRPRPEGPAYEYSFAVVTVGADGSGLREVHGAGHCGCFGLPAPSVTWSPDGERIAVAVPQGEGGGGIYTMKPDGSDWEVFHFGSFVDVAWQPVLD